MSSSPQISGENEKPHKKYATITSDMRIQLIQKVLKQRSSIARACRQIGVKFTTGCLIVNTYRKNHRIFKKPGTPQPNLLEQLPKIQKKKFIKMTRSERYMARTAKTQFQDEDSQDNNQNIQIQSQIQPARSQLPQNYNHLPNLQIQNIIHQNPYLIPMQPQFYPYCYFYMI